MVYPQLQDVLVFPSPTVCGEDDLFNIIDLPFPWTEMSERMTSTFEKGSFFPDIIISFDYGVCLSSLKKYTDTSFKSFSLCFNLVWSE